MKKIERILIKIIITQFIFLLLTQLIFQQFNAFPELKQITKYEGVNKNSFSEFLQTYNGK